MMTDTPLSDGLQTEVCQNGDLILRLTVAGRTNFCRLERPGVMALRKSVEDAMVNFSLDQDRLSIKSARK